MTRVLTLCYSENRIASHKKAELCSDPLEETGLDRSCTCSVYERMEQQRDEDVMNWEEQTFSLPAGGNTTAALHFDPARPLQVTLHIDPVQGLITLTTSLCDGQVTPPSAEASDTITREMLQQTYVEQEMVQIFSTVLEIPLDEVERDSDFFACGGDSLATIAVATAIEGRFHIHIDPVMVFDHPVVSDLAAIALEHWKSKGDTRWQPSEEGLS